MPDEVYDKVIDLAKKEKRKKSPMAAMLIEDGLKMSEPITITGDSLIGVYNRKP